MNHNVAYFVRLCLHFLKTGQSEAGLSAHAVRRKFVRLWRIPFAGLREVSLKDEYILYLTRGLRSLTSGFGL
jgi:hypothetical protein